MRHRYSALLSRRRATFAVLGAAVVGTIAGTTIAGATVFSTAATATAVMSPAVGTSYLIVSRSSGMAVDDTGWSTADGTPIVQWTRTGAANQQFDFLPSGAGWFRIRSRHSGKVLDDRGWSKADGGQVIQYTDRDTSNQQWRLEPGDGYVMLINRLSGKALDVTGSSTAEGTPLRQYVSRDAADQQWTLVPVGVSTAPAPPPSAPPTATPPPTPTPPVSTTPTTTPRPTPTSTPTSTPTPTQPPTATATAVPTTASGPPPASGPDQCAGYASIIEGKYWINNNSWGAGSGTGNQCITGGGTSGDTISWSTHWAWTGKSNSVKTFASAVMGWHWGVKVAGSGLPVQLSSGKRVDSTWRYNLLPSGPNTLDVSYDMWLHAIPNPTYADTPTDEIMVWLNRSGGAGPVGTKQLSVTIDGAVWDLYRGNIGWNVFSFVRETPSTDSSLNLMDFFQDLVRRGWVQNSKYLTSVESGTEIFTGTGRLDTLAYSTTVH